MTKNEVSTRTEASATEWSSDIKNAPRDREFLVHMSDGHYHVAKYFGAEKKAMVIGGAFGFDRTEKIVAWKEIQPADAETNARNRSESTPPAVLAAPQPPVEGLREALEEANAALDAVAEFMRGDVQSGDSDLWTPEFEEMHDQVIVARAKASAALASPSLTAGPVAWQRRMLVGDIWSKWHDATPAQTLFIQNDITKGATDVQLRPLYAALDLQGPGKMDQ